MGGKRVHEAELRLSADDRMSRVIDKAFKDMQKAAKQADISKELSKVAREADKMQSAFAAANRTMSARDATAKAQAEMQRSADAAAKLARELDVARKAKAAFDGVRKARGSEEERRYREAARAVTELTAAHRKAENEAKKLTTALAQEATALRSAERAAEGFGIDLSNLTRHEARLRQEVERTNAALKKQIGVDGLMRGAATGAGGGFAGAGVGIGAAARFGAAAAGTAGGAFVVGDAMRRSVKTFGDTQTAAKDLAITSGRTDAQVAPTIELFRKEAPAYGATVKEALDVTKQFVAAGLDYDTAVKATLPTLKAARASFGEFTDTGKAGVAALNNLKITAAELPEAFNRMAKAGKEGNIELKNLATILPAIAASGSKLGLTGLSGLTDIASALEVVGKVTGSPDEAANRLQNLFEKITAGETVKNFKDLGKELGRVVDLEKEIKKGESRGESALAVILRLTKELTKGDPFKINELFGDMQARAAIEALLKFEEEYNRIRRAVNTGSAGMIDKDFGQAMDRLQGDFQKLEATIDRLGGKIGEAFAPGIRSATNEANNFLTRLLEGETILQRLASRYGGQGDPEAAKDIESKMAGESGPAKWFEENLPWLSGKKWNEWIDSKIGATSADAARLAQADRAGAITRRQEREGVGGAVGSALLNFGLGGFNAVDPGGRYGIGSHDRALTAGKEAGTQLTKGVAKGIADTSPEVQQRAREMHQNIKELLSQGILIPIGFQNRLGGGFGGDGYGGGIVRASYSPGGSAYAGRGTFGGGVGEVGTGSLGTTGGSGGRYSPLPPGRPGGFSPAVPRNAFGGTDVLSKAAPSAAGAFTGGGAAPGAEAGRLNARPPDSPGLYRPQYTLTEADTHQRVLDTIASEARMRDPESVDGVINNMLNRVGSKGWGPSANLYEVSQARGQYEGAWKGRRATERESEYLRKRIAEIASGGVPDNTGGSNSFRAESYYRGAGANRKWARTSVIGNNVGGNRYGFVRRVPNGPYAPYDPSAVAGRPGLSAPFAAKDGPGLQIPDAPLGKGGFGLGGISQAAQELRAATERLSSVGWKSHHTVEVSAAPGSEARTKSMRATASGPVHADVGVSMPHTRSRATV